MRCSFGVLRGVLQYGLLHFGQSRGCSSFARGTDSWLQHSQRKLSSVIFAVHVTDAGDDGGQDDAWNRPRRVRLGDNAALALELPA